MKVKIDVNQRLVVATYSGEISDAEILDLASQISFHPDFDPSFSIMWDFSAVTAGTISTSAIRELSRRESILSPTSMHVVIAPQDHIFGLFRMGQVLAEEMKPNIVVVRTIDEAWEHLGLEGTG
jgi:hypothetical protein